jgi:formylglycine-generating enzyme required for sulfatase activity
MSSQPIDTLIHSLLVPEARHDAFQAQLQHAITLTNDLTPDERRAIASQIAPLMIDPQREPDPYRRATYGRILGLLDLDHRAGIGLNADGLPEIDWVTIPEGEFIYQQDQRMSLPTFLISRYHITYRQFLVFLDADDGFVDPRWWDGFAEQKERFRVQNSKPVQQFPFWNHPFDNACWYDAMAFCRWWSYRLGGRYDIDRVHEWKVRLPTEQEWEKAARGTDGRRYAWGDTFVSGYANFDETDRYNFQQDQAKIRSGKIGSYFYGAPTAPGIFPQAASPYGVMDMIGTMWDITLTDYRTGKNDDMRDYYPRVIRGGTWFVTEVYCHTQNRTMFHPHIRGTGNPRQNDYSFRVVAQP